MSRSLRLPCTLALLLLFAQAAVADDQDAYHAVLFNGHDLEGWQVNGCEAVVENGAIVLKSGDGFVRANGVYGDFALSLEWRALKPADYDSGIYIRSPLPAAGKPWPERYQINLRQGEEGNLLGAASATSRGLAKKPGEWNHFEIRVVGDQAELKINGHPAWKAAGLTPAEGVIGFQSEVAGGGQFEFRNIEITELDFRPLSNGRDLTGWHVSSQTGHSGPSQNKSGGRWVVEEGAIVGSQDVPGNGGIVVTDAQFGDFEVALEMKNDFGPDSGLFLRSNDKGQAYQYMVDYHGGGNLAGVYGEGLSGGIHVRNFDFLDKVTEIRPHEAPFPLPIMPSDWPKLWTHGRWNELRARIVGNPPQITTWINGVQFMEFADNEKRHQDKGSIALQVHGGGDFTQQFVRYRRIRLRRIDAAAR